jgi:hypothetical protein
VASNDRISSQSQPGETDPGKATSTPPARPRPILGQLFHASIRDAMTRYGTRPEGRRRAELNRDGQIPAAALVNTQDWETAS